jgi:hypothetical protein
MGMIEWGEDRVSRQKMKLTKKQEANLEYSYKWLTRARQDFNVFKKLVTFDKKTQRIVRCSDPAMAVGLLQQSIEKASKAIAAASGLYSYKRLRKFSHNSLVVILDFFVKTISSMLSTMELEPMFAAFGLDAAGDLNRVRELKGKAKKTIKDKQAGETLYREEFAAMSPEAVNGVLDLLLLIRNKAYLGTLSSVFGPHGNVRISAEAIDTDSKNEEIVDSLLSALQVKLNIPDLSEEQKKPLVTLVEIIKSGDYDLSDVKSGDKATKVGRDTDEWLGQWAMVSLMFLAAITFPHQNTSRYPMPKNITSELGCEDYNEKLGIVNKLGKLGYVTELAITEIKPQLEAITHFFSVVESKKSMAKK